MMQVKTLLSERGILTKESGERLTIKCLSPEHEDTNPSMAVNASTGDAHCFSCGFNTNVYTFFGIIHNRLNSKAYGIIRVIDRKRNPSITMPEGSINWSKEHRSIKSETLLHFRAFENPLYFKDKICFPIYGYDGAMKAILSRDLYSSKSKYNIYPSGVPLPILPMRPSAYKNSLIIVEGIFDMLNAYDKGLKNVICTFGISLTKAIVEQILAIVAYLGVTRVILAYDNDSAGKIANTKAKEILEGKIPEVTIFDWTMFDEKVPKDFGDLTQDDFLLISSILYGKKK